MDLIDSTGGAMVSVSDDPLEPTSGTTHDPSQVGILLAAQIRQILTYYQIEVELPMRFDKPQTWKLETTPMKNRHTRVIYPRTLPPCRDLKSAVVPAP
ncbi:MAG TPA: hypothetical protein VN822_00225 [Candidatus Acidoferrales bacterium]|nr:hypothetical protein [Candidatus Acidoferrales bacterium]